MASKLKALAKKTETEGKKKDTHPTLALGPEQGLQVLRWVEGKRDERGGESRRKKEEELLLPVVEKIHKDYCIKNGEYHSSAKIATPIGTAKKQLIDAIDEKLKTETDVVAIATATARKAQLAALPDELVLKFTINSSYSKISVDHEDVLREAVGDECYEKWFSEKVEIALTEKGVAKIQADEALIDKLITLLGGDDCVQVTFHLEPTELFHTTRRTDPKVVETADKLIKDKLITPYKPSFKED